MNNKDITPDYDYITTYTGKHFYPNHPDPELFDVRDFAHALSLMCRGNGHVNVFFSIAQHCIYCAKEAEARGYSSRQVLACLLHDASECYLSDVPRPFKKTLTGYKESEDKLLSLIYTHFLGSDLTDEEQKKLREIDDDLLWFDLEYLLNEPTGKPKPPVHIDIQYPKIPDFETTETEYTDIFQKYYERIRENERDSDCCGQYL